MSEWLRDLQRAAQRTAEREQRGEQMSLGDVAETTAAAEDQTEQTATASAARRPASPFTGRDPGRDYRRMYRALYTFHERHSPAIGDALYWAEVTEDMEQLAEAEGNDPFMVDLLAAVFAELEREAGAQGQQPRS